MRSNEKFTRRSEDAIEKARQAAGMHICMCRLWEQAVCVCVFVCVCV